MRVRVCVRVCVWWCVVRGAWCVAWVCRGCVRLCFSLWRKGFLVCVRVVVVGVHGVLVEREREMYYRKGCEYSA